VAAAKNDDYYVKREVKKKNRTHSLTAAITHLYLILKLFPNWHDFFNVLLLKYIVIEIVPCSG